jgi:F0F1-type ATP synthase assembly protein I
MQAESKINHGQLHHLKNVMMLSALGFTMVTVSFLFLYIGYRLDQLIDTSPNFMLGFFLLGVFLSVMRLYQEACATKKNA